MKHLLRAWVLVRLPLPLLLAALAPGVVGALVGGWLTRLDYAHGTVKFLLIAWQSMLLREGRILAGVLLAAVAGAILVGLSGKRWTILALLSSLTLLGILRPHTLWLAPLALGLLALNLLPPHTLARVAARFRPLAWLPGTELLTPVPLAAALGAGPGLLRAVAALGAATLVGAWVTLDTFTSFSTYEKLLFAPWEDSRVDPRVTTIARAPEGVKCDFHDIDILGDRAVVVAESSLKLLDVPLDAAAPAGGWPLTPWWGPMEGLALDSETDPATGTSWYVSGPQQVTAVKWDGQAWGLLGRSRMLPGYMHHMYMSYLPEKGRLVLFTIGTHNSAEGIEMIELETPDLQKAHVMHLRLPDGGRPPTIRDIVWVPTLDAFVLAPDFGDRLYLARLGHERVEPWMEMPTLNGRLTWVEGLERLFVPLPNRPELWVVDPKTASVERRIPTQPGVRTLDVDVKRGVVLTASVLTGRVLVQKLDDGDVVDSFGTLMPMVRNLVVAEDQGVALLSTWTALYRIPYATR